MIDASLPSSPLESFIVFTNTPKTAGFSGTLATLPKSII
jgi:hypothetical protein